MQITKIQTNNPIVDNLVYYIKKLGLESIAKDEAVAFKYETLSSIRESELYLICIEGKATFVTFESYNRSQLERAGIPEDMIKDCLLNKFNIPTELRTTILNYAIQDTINNYVETNKYYLNANGEPGEGDEVIYIDQEITDVDISKPIHMMNPVEIQILEKIGIIDDLKLEYPNTVYLNFLGERKVSYYESRRAPKFGLLYTPPDIPSAIDSKFRLKYEKSRVYTLKCVYSDAFKLGSDYYDHFIQMFIKLQTMCDIIVELPEFIVRRELFDVQSVRYMFESNGVKFFDSIPLKYQMRMLKNLNKLIKFKSSDKNIVDICSIFGFENIEIFKYYMLRDHKLDSNGKFIFSYDLEQNEVVEDMYDLQFIKVPIDDDLDNYVRDVANRVSYNEMTLDDPYWTGDNTAEYVKKELLKKEFNTMRSKYISIDTVYDVTKLSFELAYFFNMLFDNDNLESNLVTYCSAISPIKKFRIADLIVLLYILTYEINGVEDTIFDTQGKILHVMGFNFKVDLMELQNYVIENGYTMEELGVSDFKIPETPYLSYNQLMEVYTKNKKIHDHLIHQMNISKNINEYRIYEKLFNSLMVSEFNQDIFKLSDGVLAPTYTEWIFFRDAIIYAELERLRGLEGPEKEIAIQDIMSAVVVSLEDYTQSTEFKYLFDNIPVLTADMVRRYIFMVIDFFKSYKIQLKSINTIYKFDDSFTNKVIRLDQLNTDWSRFEGILEKQNIKDKLFGILSRLINTDEIIPEDILEELWTKRDDADVYKLINKMWIDFINFDSNEYGLSQQYRYIPKGTDISITIKDNINIGENVDYEY